MGYYRGNANFNPLINIGIARFLTRAVTTKISAWEKGDPPPVDIVTDSDYLSLAKVILRSGNPQKVGKQLKNIGAAFAVVVSTP